MSSVTTLAVLMAIFYLPCEAWPARYARSAASLGLLLTTEVFAVLKSDDVQLPWQLFNAAREHTARATLTRFDFERGSLPQAADAVRKATSESLQAHACTQNEKEVGKRGRSSQLVDAQILQNLRDPVYNYGQEEHRNNFAAILTRTHTSRA